MQNTVEAPSSNGLPATVVLIGALAVATAFRAYLLIANDFPVNDGGLFLQFVRETVLSFPWPPADVEYNGLTLPFAYPPLSFWLGALLTKVGFNDLQVVRVMPIVLNLLYVLLFATLLLKSGQSRLFTALAILFMAVTLRSFEWLLMGGGLSRGLGAVFLLLSLLAITLPRHGQREDVSLLRSAGAGALVGGAILSHLEWGILAAASVVLSRSLGSLSLKQFLSSVAIAGATAAMVILPWLHFVYGHHGLQPLLAASGSSGWSLKAVALRMIEFTIVAGLGNPFIFLGGLMLLVRKQWFWIGFLVISAVLTPRHALTPQMLPMAVFAAQGLVSAYEFASRFTVSKRLVLGGSAAIVAALLLHGAARSNRDSGTAFQIIPQEKREAMAWVRENERGKRFAVVSGRAWQNDSTAEWFPILASAVSVTTVQGREWNGQYERWYDLSEAVRKSSSCNELHRSLRQFGEFHFVWAEAMQHCFKRSSAVFRSTSVTISRHKDEEPLTPR